MRVKICCIKSIDEASMALDAGADALGLVSEMPSGPGVIDESTIAAVAAYVGDQAKSVLLTSLATPEAIAAQVDRCGVNAVQLCTWLNRPARTTLRSLLPDHFLMQVVHVTGPEAVAKSNDDWTMLDALLLDSGTLSGPTIELGGTGRTHDWNLSLQIRESVDRPIFLAGGLNAENVASAIGRVDPAGVDICSGVRSNGVLDRQKLEAFVRSAKAA